MIRKRPCDQFPVPSADPADQRTFFAYSFRIIKKITGNEWIALFSATGILLSPILLGMSQIVNPDSLFWIFASSSFFSFSAYLSAAGKS